MDNRFLSQSVAAEQRLMALNAVPIQPSGREADREERDDVRSAETPDQRVDRLKRKVDDLVTTMTSIRESMISGDVDSDDRRQIDNNIARLTAINRELDDMQGASHQELQRIEEMIRAAETAARAPQAEPGTSATDRERADRVASGLPATETDAERAERVARGLPVMPVPSDGGTGSGEWNEFSQERFYQVLGMVDGNAFLVGRVARLMRDLPANDQRRIVLTEYRDRLQDYARTLGGTTNNGHRTAAGTLSANELQRIQNSQQEIADATLLIGNELLHQGTGSGEWNTETTTAPEATSAMDLQGARTAMELLKNALRTGEDTAGFVARLNSIMTKNFATNTNRDAVTQAERDAVLEACGMAGTQYIDLQDAGTPPKTYRLGYNNLTHNLALRLRPTVVPASTSGASGGGQWNAETASASEVTPAMDIEGAKNSLELLKNAVRDGGDTDGFVAQLNAIMRNAATQADRNAMLEVCGMTGTQYIDLQDGSTPPKTYRLGYNNLTHNLSLRLRPTVAPPDSGSSGVGSGDWNAGSAGSGETGTGSGAWNPDAAPTTVDTTEETPEQKAVREGRQAWNEAVDMIMNRRDIPAAQRRIDRLNVCLTQMSAAKQQETLAAILPGGQLVLAEPLRDINVLLKQNGSRVELIEQLTVRPTVVPTSEAGGTGSGEWPSASADGTGSGAWSGETATTTPDTAATTAPDRGAQPGGGRSVLGRLRDRILRTRRNPAAPGAAPAPTPATEPTVDSDALDATMFDGPAPAVPVTPAPGPSTVPTATVDSDALDATMFDVPAATGPVGPPVGPGLAPKPAPGATVTPSKGPAAEGVIRYEDGRPKTVSESAQGPAAEGIIRSEASDRPNGSEVRNLNTAEGQAALLDSLQRLLDQLNRQQTAPASAPQGPAAIIPSAGLNSAPALGVVAGVAPALAALSPAEAQNLATQINALQTQRMALATEGAAIGNPFQTGLTPEKQLRAIQILQDIQKIDTAIAQITSRLTQVPGAPNAIPAQRAALEQTLTGLRTQHDAYIRGLQQPGLPAATIIQLAQLLTTTDSQITAIQGQLNTLPATPTEAPITSEVIANVISAFKTVLPPSILVNLTGNNLILSGMSPQMARAVAEHLNAGKGRDPAFSSRITNVMQSDGQITITFTNAALSDRSLMSNNQTFMSTIAAEIGQQVSQTEAPSGIGTADRIIGATLPGPLGVVNALTGGAVARQGGALVRGIGSALGL